MRHKPIPIAGILLLLSAALLAPLPARADAPNLLSYQGRLKDSGLPVTAARTVEIFLCNALTGGACTTTGAQSVGVVNGLFRTTFTVPSSVNLASGSWYLEIKVESTTLSPRERLSSNVYALYASSASALIATPGQGSISITTNVFIAGSTLTVNGKNSAGYSLALSSGLFMPNGTVNAKYFVGDGSGLQNVGGSDSSKVSKNGDVVTGHLLLSGSSLTVTGLDAEGYGLAVAYGITAGSATFIEGISAASATLRQTGNNAFSLETSSGIWVRQGTLLVDGQGGVVATRFTGDGSGLTNVGGSDSSKVSKTGDTMSGDLQVGGATASTISASGFVTLANLSSPPSAAPGRLYFDPANGGALMLSLDGSGYVQVSTEARGGDFVKRAGDSMIGHLLLSNSSLTVTGLNAGGFGVTVAYGLSAGSATLAGGLQAASATLTQVGSNSYSLQTSSGILVSQGTLQVNGTGGVVASRITGAFFGDGSGLTNVGGSDTSRVSRTGDAMTGQLTLSDSTLTVTGQDAGGYGLGVLYGISAGSAVFSAGVQSSSATFTQVGNNLYSLQTSSGILVQQGTLQVNGTGGVVATRFTGDGSGLTNIFAADSTKVSKAGDTMTGQLTLAGSSLTVLGQEAGFGLGVQYGLYAASATIANGLQAASATLTQVGGNLYSLQTSSGILIQQGTLMVNGTGGVVATRFTGDGSGLTNLSGTDSSKVSKAGDTMTGQLTLAGSSLTVLGQEDGFGLGVQYGLYAASATIANGLQAASATLTQVGSNLYSLQTSSGILIEQGTLQVNGTGGVVATRFTGDGSGLTNLSGTDSSKVSKAGDTMTGQLTLAGSSLTVLGQEDGFGLGVQYGLYAASATIATGLQAASATFTQSGSSLYSLQTSSGILIQQGTLMVNGTGGVVATRFTGDGSGLTGVTGTDAGRVSKAGDIMTGHLLMSDSSMTVLGQDAMGFGLDVEYGIIAGSATLVAGLQAASATLTQTGSNLYSLVTSSGILVQQGTIEVASPGGVVAPRFNGAFFGDGAGLANVSGTDSSRVLKAGDAMTGQLTLLGSTLTITGQDGDGEGLFVQYGFSADKAYIANGIQAGSATFTQAGSQLHSLRTSSGILVQQGTIEVAGTGGVVAPRFNGAFFGDGAGLENVTGTDATRVLKTGDMMTGPLTFAGSSLTVLGQDGGFGLGVQYGLYAGSATIQAGLQAASATFTQTGGYSLQTASGIWVQGGVSEIGGELRSQDLYAQHGYFYDLFAGTLAVDGHVFASSAAFFGPVTLAGSSLTVTGNAFSVGGSDLVLAGGNVGIGAQLPSSRLHVSGGDLQVGDLFASTFSQNGYLTFAGLTAPPPLAPGRIYFDPSGLGAFKLSLDGASFVEIATQPIGGYVQRGGDSMTGDLTLLNSTLSVTGIGSDGYSLRAYKILADSMTVASALSASSVSAYNLSVSSILTAVSADMTSLGSWEIHAGSVTAFLADISTLTAGRATISTLTVSELNISTLTVPLISASTLTAYGASFSTLTASSADISTLTVSSLSISTLTVPFISVSTLTAYGAGVSSLTATSAVISTLTAFSANISSLTAFNLSLSTLTANSAVVSTLTASLIDVSTLSAAQFFAPYIGVSTLTVSSVTATGISASNIAAPFFSGGMVSVSTMITSMANVGNTLYVGGSTLTVDSGRVGIGTTVPQQKLHLRYQTFLEDPLFIEGTGGFGLRVRNDGTIVHDNIGPYNGIDVVTIGSGTTIVNGQGNLLAIHAAGSSTGNLLHAGRGNVSKFVVAGSDNVGISSETPTYRLTVSTGANEMGTILAVTTGTSVMFQVKGTGEVVASRFTGDGSGLTGVLAAGSVSRTGDSMTGDLTLINSTLTVTGFDGSQIGLRVDYGIQGSSITLSDRATARSAYVTGSGYSGASPFFTVGAASLTVTADGNVGIGIPAPTRTLDVSGSAEISRSAYLATLAGGRVGIGTVNPSAFLMVSSATTDNSSTIFVLNSGAAGDFLTAKANGYVGIGTSDPQRRLDIGTGQVYSRWSHTGDDTPSIVAHNSSSLFSISTGTYGIYGAADSPGAENKVGIYGKAMGASGNKIGVYGESTDAGGTNWAGYFVGDVHVSTRVSIGNTTNTTSKLWVQADNKNTYIMRVSSQNGTFDHMVIDSSGRVGVGMLTPSATMQINGDLGLGDGTDLGNKPVVIWLKNNSGATRSAGEIVVVDQNMDNAFNVTTTASSGTAVGIVYEDSIPNGSVGRIAVSGGVVSVLTDSVGAFRGRHVTTSSTLGQAQATSTPSSGASIGVWLETGTGRKRALLR